MRRRANTAQESLFAADELLISETLDRFRKSVAAIHAVPVKAEHAQTLNSRRVFDACIVIAQLEARKRGPDFIRKVREDRVSPIFEVRVSELARLAGIPGENYVRIYQELEKLFEMVLRWNVVNEDAKVQWEMKSHFLSSFGKGVGEQKGLVRFSLDPVILEIVLEPSIWATLSLQALRGLDSASSYALYTNTFRYVNTHHKVTPALPTATWVELLLGPCGYLERDSDGTVVVRRYADFKRRVLVDAIRRVNECPALAYTLELREILTGKRVTRLQFKFIPKKTESLGIPLTWPDSVVDTLRSIGCTEKDIEDMSLSRSYDEVVDALGRLREAEARKIAQGGKIHHRKRYFEGILENIASGNDTDDLDQMEERIRIEQARAEDAERRERLRAAFEKHFSEAFKKGLFALSEDARRSITTVFEQSKRGQAVRPFFDKGKGWRPTNERALRALRDWMAQERPVELEGLVPDPKDRSFEAWAAWRVESVVLG